MPVQLLVFLVLAFFIRIAALIVSRRNEHALIADGATEYGAANSTVLAVMHVTYYTAAPVECWQSGWPMDLVTWVGMLIYIFGIAWLVAVIVLLGRFWTVRLILAKDHVLVTHALFRLIRHPNYFLAIVPELIGYAVVFQAWMTLTIGLSAYAVPLVLRIREEESVMRRRFVTYADARSFHAPSSSKKR